MDEKKDKGLQGNEKIEEAILALQQEPTEELLAHALTDGCGSRGSSSWQWSRLPQMCKKR